MAEAAATATDPRKVMTQKEQKEAAKDGRLLAWQCKACGHKSITPMYVCPVDKSRDVGVAELPGTGVVEAYTIQKLIAPEEFLNDIPFAFVVVKLDDGARRAEGSSAPSRGDSHGGGTLVSGMVLDVARDADLPAGTRVKHAPSYKSVYLFEKA